ncbi:MAG TPA: DUF4139 domain-containing protein [Gammaproteobacteria bacterium]
MKQAKGWRKLTVTGVSALLFCGAALAVGSTSLDERRTTLADQRSVAVTIYNENLALVKEVRGVELATGLNRLAVRDVSAMMRPETALLRALRHPAGLRVLEQNFDFDLLTPDSLLEKYVGRTVGIVQTHPTTGKETVLRGEVLSAQNGVVLRIGERIETGIPGRLVFDSVPENLRDRPTLSLLLDNANRGKQELELSYLSGGLSWRADYVAELAPGDDKLDLTGLITLTNASGTAYPNAKLQLVAGDVNLVRERFRDLAEFKGAAMPAAPMVSEEALFEYHLYTLERPTTIADNQTKQVALLNAAGVAARKQLVLEGQNHYYFSSMGELGQKLKLDVMLEFDNNSAAHLGMPLPKGIVRVYKRDASGNAQFVGEDAIDHTAKNETVRLKLGQSFDVTADKTQTDFRSQKGTGRKSEYESAYRIVLKNAKNSPAMVTVREPIPGDWKMVEESHPHQKVAAAVAQWQLTVPAEGQLTLSYRVRSHY